MKSTIDFFPFENLRSTQRELLACADDAIADDEKRLVVLEAPTGVGKSAVAIAIARWYEAHDVSTTIITKTKHLQDQYAEEFNIPLLKGAGNYEEEGGYASEVKSYADSMIGITNFAKLPTSPMKDVLIIDEAMRFSSDAGASAYYQFTKAEMESDIYLDRIKEAGMQYSTLKAKSLLINLQCAGRGVGNKGETPNEELRLKAYRFFQTLDRLVGMNKETRVKTYKQNGEIMFHVDAAPIVIADILKRYKKVFMLSANYANMPFFLKTIGLEEDDSRVAVKSIQQSVFDPDNRPIRFVKIHAIGQADRYKRTKIIVNELLDPVLAKEYSPDKNGIVHTFSYAYANLVMKMSKYKDKMILVSDPAKLPDLSKVKGKILVSPVLGEGVDFKGDLATYQVIMKSPMAPVKGANLFKVFNYGRIAINRDAAIDVVQQAGRIIRSRNCSGTTYILDKNFSRVFGPKSKKFYPPYFLDNFKVITCINKFQDWVKPDEEAMAA